MLNIELTIGQFKSYGQEAWIGCAVLRRRCNKSKSPQQAICIWGLKVNTLQGDKARNYLCAEVILGYSIHLILGA